MAVCVYDIPLKESVTMAYVPPPPGSTVAGEPTPQGVQKQDVHITDLPPEVRKSFLLSMVFFPSMVGAAICVALFLGWVTLFKPKEPTQYAQELESPDMRRRWTAAREMSEHITPYGEKDNARIYAPEVLTSLIKIMENPDLDKETDTWSPSGSIKQEQEKSSIRWWAAYTIGHVGAKLKDPADSERAYQALMKALEEKTNIAIWAAKGLSLMRDARASEALARHLETDSNAGVRWACAITLGSIGEYQMQRKEGFDAAERIRNYLVESFQRENAKPVKDEFVLNNLAVAMAHMHESAGLARLHELEVHDDPVVREIARHALEVLNTPLTKESK